MLKPWNCRDENLKRSHDRDIYLTHLHVAHLKGDCGSDGLSSYLRESLSLLYGGYAAYA